MSYGQYNQNPYQEGPPQEAGYGGYGQVSISLKCALASKSGRHG